MGYEDPGSPAVRLETEEDAYRVLLSPSLDRSSPSGAAPSTVTWTPL